MLTRAKIIPYCAPHTLAHIRESPPPPPTASKHTDMPRHAASSQFQTNLEIVN